MKAAVSALLFTQPGLAHCMDRAAARAFLEHSEKMFNLPTAGESGPPGVHRRLTETHKREIGDEGIHKIRHRWLQAYS